MEILKQIFIIFCICIISELISQTVLIGIPASLIGMIILFLLLLTKVVKEEHIKETADFLMKIMAMVFAPICISVIEELLLLNDKLFAISVTMILTTMITFFSTYFVTTFVVKLHKKRRRSNV